MARVLCFGICMKTRGIGCECCRGWSGVPWANGCRLDGSWGARFMANQRLREGVSLPRRPKKHSIAVLCVDVKKTFGADLVRVYCALWP